MRILALDLGKYKIVACEYTAETGEHSFATIASNPKAVHDLLVDREPDRVEICSIAGWVSDLVPTAGAVVADRPRGGPTSGRSESDYVR